MWAIILKFLTPILVELAINIGLPEALKLIVSKGLPQDLADSILKIIKDAIGEIRGLKNSPDLNRAMLREGIRGVKKQARVKAKKVCEGAACPTELK